MATTITINREQREAIYEEVVLDLSGLGDLWMEFDRGDYDRARDLRRRFELDMRLLDDLGWEPETDGDEFALTMVAPDLAAVAAHLMTRTGAILHTHIVEPIEEARHAQRSVTAQTAFGAVLGRLAQDAPADKSEDGDR